MADATQTMPSGNEDLGAEASEHVQAQATRVADQALWDLGINIRENVREKRDVQYITEGIVNSIRDRIGNLTQFNINESQLGAEMRSKIAAAMERSSGMGGTFEHLTMLREVASAVTSTIPPEVIHQLVNQRFAQALPPQYLDATDMLLEPGRIRVDATVLGQSRDLIIDTQSPFWTQNDFKDEPALVKGLDGKTLREAGMVIRGVHDSHIITDTEAVDIARKSATVNRLPDTNAVVDEMVTDTAKTPLRLQVNIRRFVERMIDDPVVLAAIGATSVTRIGSLDQTQLTTLLTGPYTYWNECVTGVPNAGMTILVPTLGGSPASHPAHEYVLERIYKTLGKTKPNPLAHSTTSPLVDIHRDVLSNAKANPYAQLRDGSENHLGAAIVSALIISDPSLRSALGQGTKAVEDNIAKKRAERAIVVMIEDLRKLKIPSCKEPWDVIEDKIKSITENIGTISSGPFKLSDGTEFEEKWNVGSNTKDVEAVRKALYDRLAQLEQDRRKYQEIGRVMESIAQVITAAGKSVPSKVGELGTFVSSTPPFESIKHQREYKPSLNLSTFCTDLEENPSLELVKLTDYDREIGELEKKREEAKTSKGLKGDAAQHAIVKQHFMKYEHMNEPDATRATNYLLGRSLLDPELAASARMVAEEIHGSNPRPEFVLTNVKEQLFGREETMVADVAEGCGLKVKRGPWYDFDWLGFRERGVQVRWADETPGGYRKLLAAYYVLRKLMSGEGPQGMKLSETAFMQKQMQAITETLLQKHLPAMLKDFGPQLTDEQKELLRAPQKNEHRAILKALLEGAPPEGVVPLIARTLNFAEQRWKRFSWRLGGALGVFSDRDWGMIRGQRNPLSFAGLLYRNPRLGLKGLYYTAPKAQWRGVKKGAGAISRNAKASWEDTKAKRWSIAKWGLAGFLIGGPVVGLGVGLLGGKLFGKREGTGGH